MSVSLVIRVPGKQAEFVSMLGQRPAEEWVADLAMQHGFKVLTGMYPTLYLRHDDLDQVIWELGIIGEDSLRRMQTDPHFPPEDIEINRELWETLVDRVKQLKDEEGWEAHFG